MSEETSTSNVSSASAPQQQYRCVECCAPATSLYKEYTKTSIKLTSCDRCNRNVDPYVERDWPLVVLDCVLLRLPAYRHVLWNSTATTTRDVIADKGTPSSQHNRSMSMRQIIMFAVMACLLQSHLHWEGLRTEEPLDSLDQDMFMKLLIYSTSGLVVQGVVNYAAGTFLSSEEARKDLPFEKMSLGLILPLTFSVVTTLVMVWENTWTVRLLGRLLETVFQFTAMLVVGGANAQVAFLLGLLARIGTYLVVGKMLSLPCLGIVLQEQYCVAF
jgi:hypothetical protein